MCEAGAKAVAVGQITLEVQRQSDLVRQLEEHAEKTEAQLVSVLREAVKEEPTPASEQKTVVCLAAQIREANDRMEKAIDRMCSVCERIEL